jgi:hypothetical protein
MNRYPPSLLLPLLPTAVTAAYPPSASKESPTLVTPCQTRRGLSGHFSPMAVAVEFLRRAEFVQLSRNGRIPGKSVRKNWNTCGNFPYMMYRMVDGKEVASWLLR